MSSQEVEKKEHLDEHNNVNVLSDPSQQLWDEGTDIEAQVFIEANYVETKEELAAEYAKYMPKTEFIVAKKDDHAGGSVRAIFYDPEIGFKTVDDINAGKLEVTEEGRELLANLSLEDTFEVGTLAVKKEFRGHPEDEGRLSVALYGAIYGESMRHNTRYVLASFDERYFRSFQGIFGPAVKELGPATDYMGSPTIPALLDIPALYEYVGSTLPDVQNVITTVSQEMQHS